jgi:hypothetical protein
MSQRVRAGSLTPKSAKISLNFGMMNDHDEGEDDHGDR